MRHLISITLIGLSFGCSHADRRGVTGPIERSEPFEISIVNVAPDVAPPHHEQIVLYVELDPAQQERIEDLCHLAHARFTDHRWVNWGPDSGYREITFSCPHGQFVLQSWHPLFEQNPNLVAGSGGISTLNGMTRDVFLQRDDPTYVDRRKAFDEIERELLQRFGS